MSLTIITVCVCALNFLVQQLRLCYINGRLTFETNLYMLVVAEINDIVHDETMSSDIIFELDDNQDVDVNCDENGKIDDVPNNDSGMPYIISFQIN
jgi:hypothetical protein